jgi:hypothetical protein
VDRVWSGRSRGSAVPFVGEGLIEVELGPGVREGGIERRSLVEREFGLRGSAGGGEGWEPVRDSEVAEDALDHGRVDEERDDPHLPVADGTEEGEDLVDAGEEARPGDAAEWTRPRLRKGLDRWGVGSDRRVRGRSDFVGDWSPESHDGAPEAGVRCESPVVGVAVDARGWDEAGESLEELDRGEVNFRAPVRVGCGEAVGQPSLR